MQHSQHGTSRKVHSSGQQWFWRQQLLQTLGNVGMIAGLGRGVHEHLFNDPFAQFRGHREFLSLVLVAVVVLSCHHQQVSLDAAGAFQSLCCQPQPQRRGVQGAEHQVPGTRACQRGHARLPCHPTSPNILGWSQTLHQDASILSKYKINMLFWVPKFECIVMCHKTWLDNSVSEPSHNSTFSTCNPAHEFLESGAEVQPQMLCRILKENVFSLRS